MYSLDHLSIKLMYKVGAGCWVWDDSWAPPSRTATLVVSSIWTSRSDFMGNIFVHYIFWYSSFDVEVHNMFCTEDLSVIRIVKLLRRSNHWATPHPLLSYITSRSAIRHTLLIYATPRWATPHPVKLRHTPLISAHPQSLWVLLPHQMAIKAFSARCHISH